MCVQNGLPVTTEGLASEEAKTSNVLPIWEGSDIETWRFSAERRFCATWNERCRRGHLQLQLSGEAYDKLKYTISCLTSVYDGIRQDAALNGRLPRQRKHDRETQAEVLCLIDMITFIGTYAELIRCADHYPYTYYQWMASFEVAWNMLDAQVYRTIRALHKAGWEPDAESLREDWLSYKPDIWYCTDPDHDKPSRPKKA